MAKNRKIKKTIQHFANECRTNTNYKSNFRNPNTNSNRDDKPTTEIKKEYSGNIRFCNNCKETGHLDKYCRKLIYKKNTLKQSVGELSGETKNLELVNEIINDNHVRVIVAMHEEHNISCESSSFINNVCKFMVDSGAEMKSH